MAGNDKLIYTLESVFMFGLNKTLTLKGHRNRHKDSMENLKDWLNNKLNPGVHINNFSTDWNSGTNFGALVDHMSPGLCTEWRNFQAIENLDNVTMLLDQAANHLQVHRIISAADMCDPEVDPLTIVIYLSQFVEAGASDITSQRSRSITSFDMSFEEPRLMLTAASGAIGRSWIAQMSRHPNVVSMAGVMMLDAQQGHCQLISVNDKRDLHNHLLRSSLSANQLLQFAIGIAKGAKYIIEHGLSLPILSTRNCILSDDGQSVMVADYRQVRHILPHDYLLQTSALYQPWRWQAIEHLNGEKNPTIWSHVWSLAVVFYELFTNGRTPHAEIDTEHQLREWLNHGRRLEKPQYTPDKMYSLMLACWNRNPNDRPTFDVIFDQLDTMLQSCSSTNAPRLSKYNRPVPGPYTMPNP